MGVRVAEWRRRVGRGGVTHRNVVPTYATIAASAAAWVGKNVAEITVHGVTEDVLARLEAQAKANGRALEDEIRDALVRHTRRTLVDAFRERTAPLCSLTANRPQTDSVAMLREERGR